MANSYNSYPQIEEEQSRFDSISDIPLHLCTISIDSNEFLVYNVENNKICAKIPNPCPFSLFSQGFLCELNGSQLFYLGGLTKAGKSITTCLLIDIKTQSVEKLKPGRPRYCATPVYFEKFVYAFGGCDYNNRSQVFSDKFNLRKNKWIRIADLPVSSLQTNAVVYERNILVTGKNLGNIWKYDPYENSYESLFELEKEALKMFFVVKGQCYVVTCSKCCYSSETNNIKNWTFYGKVRGNLWPCSNTCFYNDSMLFFDQRSRICKFDFNRLAFFVLAITKDTVKSETGLSEINSQNNNNNKKLK